MRSVQQEVMDRMLFCPHNHMIDTGHAGNCGRVPQLVYERSRGMVLEFLPGMQETPHTWIFIKSSPDLFTTHIYITMLCIIQQWRWDHGGWGARCGVGLPAILVHVRFSMCPRGWPGTLRGFKGLLSVAWSLPQRLHFCDEHMMLLIHNYNLHIFW